jgi:hypothetical protein
LDSRLLITGGFQHVQEDALVCAQYILRKTQAMHEGDGKRNIDRPWVDIF